MNVHLPTDRLDFVRIVRFQVCRLRFLFKRKEKIKTLQQMGALFFLENEEGAIYIKHFERPARLEIDNVASLVMGS